MRSGPARRSRSRTRIGAQTEQVFANLRAILEAAGTASSGVVKTTVYLRNLGDFQEMNEVYSRYVGDLPPARATIEVSALPGGLARRDRRDRPGVVKESIAEELRAEPRFAHVLEAITEADDPAEPVYVVGGAVRDALLGHPSYDLDLVVEGDVPAFAQRLAGRLGGRVQTHEAFGTAEIFYEGGEIDVATARTETYAEPAALPEVQAATLEDDLARRDFTINAIAASLCRDDFGRLVDPHHGAHRPRRETVRILHEPVVRGRPDPDFPGDPVREPARLPHGSTDRATGARGNGGRGASRGPAARPMSLGCASGRPTARTAIARAAITYCSMNDGDTCRPLAMLSKCLTSSSCGRNSPGSTSSASRSWTAFAYPCDSAAAARSRDSRAGSPRPRRESFEPRNEGHESLLVGPWLLRRRHQVTAQLANGLLERLGVLREVLGLDLREIEPAREVGGVVEPLQYLLRRAATAPRPGLGGPGHRAFRSPQVRAPRATPRAPRFVALSRL